MRSYTPALNLLFSLVKEPLSKDDNIREKKSAEARILIDGICKLQKLEAQQAITFYQDLSKELKQTIDPTYSQENIFDTHPDLLRFAIGNGHTAIVYALLNAGMSPQFTQSDVGGLSCAVLQNRPAIIKALLYKLPPTFSPTYCIRNVSYECLDALLDSPLHSCSFTHYPEAPFDDPRFFALLLSYKEDKRVYPSNYSLLHPVRMICDYPVNPVIKDACEYDYYWCQHWYSFPEAIQTLFAGKIYEAKQEWKEATTCYEQSKTEGCLYADRALGDLARQQQNFSEAIACYNLAMNRGDVGAIAHMVDLAEQLTKLASCHPSRNDTATKEVALKRIETSPLQKSLYSIFSRLQTSRLAAYFTPSQWRFLARIAIDENCYFQTPSHQAHFALRISQRAREKSKTEGLSEAKITSWRAYCLFKQTITPANTQQFTDLLLQEALAIIEEYDPSVDINALGPLWSG